MALWSILYYCKDFGKFVSQKSIGVFYIIVKTSVSFQNTSNLKITINQS